MRHLEARGFQHFANIDNEFADRPTLALKASAGEGGIRT
jgi:hypothetical protein